MEYRDLYDKNRKLTGKKIKKGDPVPKGLFYITVSVFIQNDDGKFLIQKRSKKKNGLYGTTGGHPKTGESSIEGAITEIFEEVGLKVKPEQLVCFKTFKTEDDYWDLYYANINFDIKKLKLQKEEVESVYELTREEVIKLVDEGLYNNPIAIKECFKYLDKKNN